MPNSIKSFTERRLKTTFLDEYFKVSLANAEYAYHEFQNTTQSTRITIYANRVGLAIGKRGKNIRMLSAEVKNILGEENVQLEVETLEEPEKFAIVMAQRLASSLERGRHFRRTAYGSMRRIMNSGAIGCEIIISGKITSQRARVESFRDGFVSKTGDVKEKFVTHGQAKAKIKRGILGISVRIMRGDEILPNDMDIIAEPTHTTREIYRPEEDIDLEDISDETVEDTIDEFGELEELNEVETSDIPEEATSAITEDNLEDLEE